MPITAPFANAETELARVQRHKNNPRASPYKSIDVDQFCAATATGCGAERVCLPGQISALKDRTKVRYPTEGMALRLKTPCRKTGVRTPMGDSK